MKVQFGLFSANIDIKILPEKCSLNLCNLNLCSQNIFFIKLTRFLSSVLPLIFNKFKSLFVSLFEHFYKIKQSGILKKELSYKQNITESQASVNYFVTKYSVCKITTDRRTCFTRYQLI